MKNNQFFVLAALAFGLGACSDRSTHDQRHANPQEQIQEKQEGTKEGSADLPAMAQNDIVDGPVFVSNAWIRPTVAEQKTTGAYLKMTPQFNGQLTGVRTELAGLAELHEMSMDGDVMRMRKLDKLDVKNGETIEFKPNGYHLMLMEIKTPITAGQLVELVLEFETEQGEKVEVPFQALALTSSPSDESVSTKMHEKHH